MLHAVGNGKNQRKCHLRHAIRAVGRNVGYDDAQLLRRLNVNHVEACGLNADVFQLGKLRQGLCIHLHLIQ